MTSTTPGASADLEFLAKRANDKLADAPAEEIVRWAVRAIGDRICVTSSMTDTVIIDLASQGEARYRRDLP